jgi:P-type Ca2+ transporter type 2C
MEGIEKEGFIEPSKEEIYRELSTCNTGLTATEAKDRLTKYGRNELRKAKGRSLALRLLYNFTNLLAILMWAGSLLAFLIHMAEVGWAIVAVIFINALFSYWQEFKAEKAIEALKNLIPSFARVIRDGEEEKILSTEVVPGDVVVFEEGDNIPADGRLIEAQELRVDNSVFSGESRPVHKIPEPLADRKEFTWTEIPNLVFAGTSAVSGDGKAIIIATGMSTEIGKIAYLTQSVKEELSPLQKEINHLTKFIAVGSVSLGLAFFLAGTLFAKMSLVASGIFAIGIILANVPEGLLPTVTLSLAMAVQRMAKRHVIIKKLSSVETLGCTNVICTDKTGTLTTNQINVQKVWLDDKTIEISGTDYEPKGTFSIGDSKEMPATLIKEDALELLLRACMLCSTAKLVPPSQTQRFWSIIGDPTEGALLVLAGKAGFDIERERERYPLVKRFPFESMRKRMTSVHKTGGESLQAFVKGSPKEVLDLSDRVVLGDRVIELTPGKRSQILDQMDGFAREGLRVLGVAYRELTSTEGVADSAAEAVEKDLTFIGLTAMHDPARPEVKGAIESCGKAGIRVVMVTGDYEITAFSIARQIGIVTSVDAEVITGATLSEMSDGELKERLKKEVIFARVNPEHKFRIVSAFKELGYIVAVTGDGANDAPALRQADIGIAMGIRGSDVAKEAAAMILTDDNFASIVAGIEEGRAVFDNIKKFITYIFAHLVPEAIPFILYAIFRIPAPITAMQILAVDLGTETLPALALGTERSEAGVMNAPPRPRGKGLVDKTLLFRGYVFLGLLNAAAVLSAYFWVLYGGGWRLGAQLEPSETTFLNPLHLKAMTVVFAGIVVMQIANVFACRSETLSVFKVGFWGNKLIFWGILFELLFTCALVYVPSFQHIFNTIGIGWKEWGMLSIFMIVVFFSEELRKRILAR